MKMLLGALGICLAVGGCLYILTRDTEPKK